MWRELFTFLLCYYLVILSFLFGPKFVEWRFPLSEVISLLASINEWKYHYFMQYIFRNDHPSLWESPSITRFEAIYLRGCVKQRRTLIGYGIASIAIYDKSLKLLAN
ncbi:hypothetical protein VNO77_17566 [Canavalia gladiata]|uniref:Uncharacterized protein n=1 Tax=Canavalia gladiata TaxID=3824 RepID=A0AAN9QIU1_CANGL